MFRYAAILSILAIGGCTPEPFVLFANIGPSPIFVSVLLSKERYGASPELQCPPEVHVRFVSSNHPRSVKSAQPELLGSQAYDSNHCAVRLELPPGQGFALGSAPKYMTLLLHSERITISGSGTTDVFRRSEFHFEVESAGNALGSPRVLVWRYQSELDAA